MHAYSCVDFYHIVIINSYGNAKYNSCILLMFGNMNCCSDVSFRGLNHTF